MDALKWKYIDKLNAIFEQLGLTNNGVAQHGGPDASLISRYRSGVRKPPSDGKQLHKLAVGIVQMSIAEKKLDQLCKLANIKKDSSIDKIIEHFNQCMQESLPEIPKDSGSKIDDMNIYDFSQRLDALMHALDVSNIRLARALHVDASLVSRFRTGMRIPSIDSWFPNQCSAWLAERAMSLSPKMRKMSLESFLPMEEMTTLEEVQRSMEQFLIHDACNHDKVFTDELLHHLNMFQYNVSIPKDLIERTLNMASSKEPHTQVYYGLEGLRKAVLDFLFVAVTLSEARTLYLYSNQSMEWMIQDAEFSKMWALLMGMILQKGHKIQIIHHVDRSMEEMFEAISKWLPLYMSGQIQSYYCDKKSERFYQTKFIIPNHCSIDANMVVGTENQAEYLFCTNLQRISYHLDQFNALLYESKSLLRIYKMEQIETYRAFMLAASEHYDQVAYLRSTLPLSTMPTLVFDQLLNRTSCDEASQKLLREIYEDQRCMLIKELRQGRVVELMHLYSDEAVFNSKVPSPFPETLVGKALTYTPQEYETHIRAIRELVREYSTYEFYILPEVPFENVEIMIKRKENTFVLKNDDPLRVFQFEHPMLCQAYEQYLHMLSMKVMPKGYDRESVIDVLTKCLT